MIFPKLQLTTAGLALLTKVVADSEELHFTKLGLGSGSTAGTSAMTNLVSSITITSLTKGTGAASMTGVLDNANLQTGYNATELGVYAQDPDDGEILYAYAFNGTNPTYIPAASSGSYERINLTVVVAIGDAEEVTATIGEFTGYASLEDFNAHVADTSNPHVVTAAQVGLGNVPNVSTDNQTPTFTGSGLLANIISGETLKVILGKIQKAVGVLINHIDAINPHSITPSMIGAISETPTAGTLTCQTGYGVHQYQNKNLCYIKQYGNIVVVQFTIKADSGYNFYGSSGKHVATISGVSLPERVVMAYGFVTESMGDPVFVRVDIDSNGKVKVRAPSTATSEDYFGLTVTYTV